MLNIQLKIQLATQTFVVNSIVSGKHFHVFSCCVCFIYVYAFILFSDRNFMTLSVQSLRDQCEFLTGFISFQV